jgi:hypothetical protein
MQKLAEYVGVDAGFVIKTVDTHGNWYVREADGTRSLFLRASNWDWDGYSDLWSRFWVILHPPADFWQEGYDWGDAAGPSWGDASGTWGSTATYDQVQTIRGLIADWKPAGTRCVNVIVAFDPASFDPEAAPLSAGLPDGLWGRWSKIEAGVQVPARLSTARYWRGT